MIALWIAIAVVTLGHAAFAAVVVAIMRDRDALRANDVHMSNENNAVIVRDLERLCDELIVLRHNHGRTCCDEFYHPIVNGRPLTGVACDRCCPGDGT